MWWPRRLSCTRCLYVDEWKSSVYCSQSDPVDPYLGLPLWLQTSLGSDRVLWALLSEHLDLLAQYIGSTLRERRHGGCGGSCLERLPAWMKSARNRDVVLRAVDRLRARAALTE